MCAAAPGGWLWPLPVPHLLTSEVHSPFSAVVACSNAGDCCVGFEGQEVYATLDWKLAQHDGSVLESCCNKAGGYDLRGWHVGLRFLEERLPCKFPQFNLAGSLAALARWV